MEDPGAVLLGFGLTLLERWGFGAGRDGWAINGCKSVVSIGYADVRAFDLIRSAG